MPTRDGSHLSSGSRKASVRLGLPHLGLLSKPIDTSSSRGRAPTHPLVFSWGDRREVGILPRLDDRGWIESPSSEHTIFLHSRRPGGFGVYMGGCPLRSFQSWARVTIVRNAIRSLGHRDVLLQYWNPASISALNLYTAWKPSTINRFGVALNFPHERTAGVGKPKTHDWLFRDRRSTSSSATLRALDAAGNCLASFASQQLRGMKRWLCS